MQDGAKIEAEENETPLELDETALEFVPGANGSCVTPEGHTVP